MAFKVESVSKVISGDFKGFKEVTVINEEGHRVFVLVTPENEPHLIEFYYGNNLIRLSNKKRKQVRKLFLSGVYKWEELFVSKKTIKRLEKFKHIEFRHNLIKTKKPIICIKEKICDEYSHHNLFICSKNKKPIRITNFFKEYVDNYYKIFQKEEFLEKLIKEGYNIIEIVSSKIEMEKAFKNRS
ncbi:hypothetical protein PDK93_25365 [Bacillus cereus]|nr:hypothetical protein [Bacillus cereus]